MKITAITKFKHGNTLSAIRRLGWTQLELARRAGISVTQVSQAINLIRKPSSKTADAIQRAFGEAGEFVDVLSDWPESFNGTKKSFKIEQTEDFNLTTLTGCNEAMMVSYNPENTAEKTEINTALINGLKMLPERERSILELYYLDNYTQNKIAGMYNLSPQGVSLLVKRALRKMNSPGIIRGIADAKGLKLYSEAERLQKKMSKPYDTN